MSQKQIIYLAGIIDGEGYLGIRKRKNPGIHYVASLCITTTSIELANFLKDIVGGYCCVTPREGNRKIQYHWHFENHSKLRDLLPKIKSYLLIKNKNCQNLLNFLSIEGRNPQLREKFCQKAKELNH